MTDTTALRNPTLEDAWDRYSRYDFNANKAQKRFVQQRKLILVLGVATTTLAIIYTVLEARSTAGIPWLSGFINTFLREQFLPALHVLVVLVPILSTALIAYSLRFNMGANWIALRSSAEALKKEIYLYRMRVGDYNPSVLGSESRDVHLARKAKVINKRLMETQVNQTGLEAYKGKLPPQYSTAEGDDGFSDMTAEQYLLWRIEDQFNYYQRKSVKFTTELQRFQLVIILLGGLGTALAAFNLEIWVAISGALATAFATFLEFKGVETTIVACNTAAADLYDVRTWWRSLSDDAKALTTNIETLVQSAEAIVQSENAGWVQEMRDALAEIYSEDKEAVSKKEAFAPVLGEKIVPHEPTADDLTSHAEPQAESDQGGSEMWDYNATVATTDTPTDGAIAEFTSDGAIAEGDVSQEPSLADITIPAADHSDPFGEPPAEPVVHEDVLADSPRDSSPDSLSDISGNPSLEDPSMYGSLGMSIDVPADSSVEVPVDSSVPVEMPAEAMPSDSPDGAIAEQPADSPEVDPTHAEQPLEESSEKPSEEPRQDEPSMTTVI